jgi:hypothetical protein
MSNAGLEEMQGFRVGEVVLYADHINRTSVRGTVIKVMPVENTARTYRIRVESERFERSVDESALSKPRSSSAERTFGL